MLGVVPHMPGEGLKILLELQPTTEFTIPPLIVSSKP